MPAERLFSCTGLIVNRLCAALTHEHVNMFVFLCKNSFLKSARSSIPNQEQQNQQAVNLVTVLEVEEVYKAPVLDLASASASDDDELM